MAISQWSLFKYLHHKRSSSPGFDNKQKYINTLFFFNILRFTDQIVYIQESNSNIYIYIYINNLLITAEYAIS